MARLIATTIGLLLVTNNNAISKKSKYFSSSQKDTSPVQQTTQSERPDSIANDESGVDVNIFDTRASCGRVNNDNVVLVSTTASTTTTSSPREDSSKEDSNGYPYYRSLFDSSSGLRRRKGSSTSASGYPYNGSRRYFTSSRRRSTNKRSSGSHTNVNPLANVRDLVMRHCPRIKIGVEPSKTVKICKTFRPLKTIVKIGADFNTQLGVWQFTSSWEDRIIGGKLTLLAGRELQYYKTWLLSVGSMGDLVTRLCLRAAVDIGTMKAHARLGFRSERLMPVNISEGCIITRQLPLIGNDGHVKLEVKANFALPEPEIEFSTEDHRNFVGMGDVEINIEELNLLLDY